jgi:L-alanine-DL-glutamate epimerase-like enolase superfamily enzyme
MRRRDFLAGAAGAAVLADWSWARDAPRDVKITRVVSVELKSRRPKHIGKNAYRHDHGYDAYERCLRVYTNAGVDGFGTCASGANECVRLLGKNPFDFFDADARQVRCPLDRYTSPLWDVCGKLLKKPVYAMLGGKGPERVAVYDGSIYFIDLRWQFRDAYADEFRREIALGQSLGHRAFKIKVGRGLRWMVRDEGYARDVEITRLVRRLLGKEGVLAVDANNGYDPAQAERFARDTADCDLAFVEELFGESVEAYLKLKEVIKETGRRTLIADGESVDRPEDLTELVEAGAVDILQGDMNRFGFEDVLREAAMARPHGAMVAPHNWGSLLGYYLQLHVGRAIENFYMAEQDPMTCPAVIADGFTIRDGRSSVPDRPGLGLQINEAEFKPETARVNFDYKL